MTDERRRFAFVALRAGAYRITVNPAAASPAA
jgi:hypothetical protein